MPTMITIGVSSHRAVTAIMERRAVLMKPVCSATPMPSIATSTTPIGWNWTKVFTILEKNAVIADMSYISPESVDAIPNTCRPMARKVYYGHGKVLLQADIYFSQECLYFVFIKDEKPMYANRINQTGVTFYTNVLNQALGMQNK